MKDDGVLMKTGSLNNQAVLADMLYTSKIDSENKIFFVGNHHLIGSVDFKKNPKGRLIRIDENPENGITSIESRKSYSRFIALIKDAYTRATIEQILRPGAANAEKTLSMEGVPEPAYDRRKSGAGAYRS